MKRIISTIEPLNDTETYTPGLMDIVEQIRKDLQDFLDDVEYDPDQDPEKVVADVWYDLKNSRDREGKYLDSKIVEQIDESFIFTGKWE